MICYISFVCCFPRAFVVLCRVHFFPVVEVSQHHGSQEDAKDGQFLWSWLVYETIHFGRFLKISSPQETLNKWHLQESLNCFWVNACREFMNWHKASQSDKGKSYRLKSQQSVWPSSNAPMAQVQSLSRFQRWQHYIIQHYFVPKILILWVLCKRSASSICVCGCAVRRISYQASWASNIRQT